MGERQAVNPSSFAWWVRCPYRRQFSILAQGVEAGSEPVEVGVRVLPRVPFPRASRALADARRAAATSMDCTLCKRRQSRRQGRANPESNPTSLSIHLGRTGSWLSVKSRSAGIESYRLHLFEPNVVGYPHPDGNGKIAADARKRGDPDNRFIGNIPTANPCSNPSVTTWFSAHERNGSALGLGPGGRRFSPPRGAHPRLIPSWGTVFQFGSFPTDRMAGYDPADEGSNPSPNTISSRRPRVTT